VIHRVKTFTEEDCNKIETTVNNLDKLWVNRSCERRFAFENSMKISKAPFWTLGAVSYLDGVESHALYNRHRDALNPLLRKKFNWIYEIICERLQSDLKEPVVIDEVLAHPGFHIFAAKNGTTIEPEYLKLFEESLGSVHVDVQYEEHEKYWKKFKEVDLTNTLSFTVPIQLPTHGGGLYTWDDKVDAYSFNYATNKLKLSELQCASVTNLYEVGEMIYFVGHLLHQMMPGKNIQPTDRRITVQGHGVKCDGVWRLYW
tara:strand:+ start:686 stop:1459 length:774 start_codon:yes stop_codon:yes gene_type:complete